MGGEHLAISNYDTLNAEEVVEKLDILSANGSPDLQAIREYEDAREDGARKTVLEKLDELSGDGPAPVASPDHAASGEGEGASTSPPIAEDQTDEHQQGATEPQAEATAKRRSQ